MWRLTRSNAFTLTGCRVKGNLLTLIHGLEHRQPPTGGKLRAQEFKDAVAKLREITATSQHEDPARRSSPARHTQTSRRWVSQEPAKRILPLRSVLPPFFTAATLVNQPEEAQKQFALDRMLKRWTNSIF